MDRDRLEQSANRNC